MSELNEDEDVLLPDEEAFVYLESPYDDNEDEIDTDDDSEVDDEDV